jgi:hypothetical protein
MLSILSLLDFLFRSLSYQYRLQTKNRHTYQCD